jgi:ribosomal protein S18 acetylase RimI-like enzyme
VIPAGLVIRPARPGEAAELAGLMERTFRDAFGAQNRPEDLAVHVARSYGVEHQARELTDPTVLTLVAEIDGALSGYAQLRDSPTPPEAVTGPRPVQLWRFYLDQAWIGRGVAQPLMKAVKQAARARGGGTLWLGVWEENPRGIAFYHKAGFVVAGRFLFHVGDDAQHDLIMVHQLLPD